MTALLTLMLITAIMSSVIALMAVAIGRKTEKDREKLTPFECGFDPYKKARAPFSLRFFLVTIIFLVFDVELALLMPLGVVGLSSDPMSMGVAAFILTLILIVGLIHEWNQGALTWIT